jgi:hypothetical protein
MTLAHGFCCEKGDSWNSLGAQPLDENCVLKSMEGSTLYVQKACAIETRRTPGAGLSQA